MLLPSNASMFNGASGVALPVKDEEALLRLPHVTVASPAIHEDLHHPHNVEILYGIDFKTFDELKPFHFLSGGPFKGPDDAIIDDVLAGSGKGLSSRRPDHDHGSALSASRESWKRARAVAN